jgi:hypothetical protein
MNDKQTKTSLRELIIKALQDSGYDTMSACKHATDFMPEIYAMPKGKHVIYCGKYEITFIKK